MERYSVTQLAFGRRYERNKLVATVLHLIKRHAKSYQCSVDGHPIARSSYKTWEGFLYENAVIEHKQYGRFVVLEVRSMTLIKHKLIGSARLADDIEWTDADRHDLSLANACAAGIRRDAEKQNRRGYQMLTSFGRNEYA